MTLFHLRNLPGDVLAASESASGLDRCDISLSLSLWDTATLLLGLKLCKLFFFRLSGRYHSDNIPSHQPGWLE